MKIRITSRLTCIISFMAIMALQSKPGLTSDSIEVVQSVPMETTLAVPGIRQTQEVWLEMIAAAQTSIYIEQFYVSNQPGQALDPVLQAIQQAAKRGVQVRLLVDTKFYKTYPDSVDEMSRIKNAEAKLIDFSSLGGVQHAKFFTVDGKQAFVGSQNFDWRALSHIHEVGLRIRDTKVIQDLDRIFEKDWATGNSVHLTTAIAGEKEGPMLAASSFREKIELKNPDSEFYVVASPNKLNPHGISDSLSELVTMMGSAQRSISIQVMEYTTKVYKNGQKPWHALDDSIREAAGRGVHVQLLVDVSNVKKAKEDLSRLKSLKNVEVRSVTIPPWSGGAIDFARLIHSKYLIVDGTVGWVGSENWSESYFMDSRDVGLVIHSKNALDQLNQIFDQVWRSHYASEL